MSSPRPLRTNWLFAILLIAALLFVVAGRIGGAIALSAISTIGFEWVLLLAGVALLLGVVNVIWLHARRIALGQRDWALSLVLIAVLIAVAGAGLLNPAGASSPLIEWVFDTVIAPGQAALFAMLIFFMAAAAFQYLRVGRRGGGWMLLGFLIILLVQTPLDPTLWLTGGLPQTLWLPIDVAKAANWFLNTPVMAALRGVLLGGALALMVVGLRLFLGRL
jgi:hypothetical protein